jgi:hypothetical protein
MDPDVFDVGMIRVGLPTILAWGRAVTIIHTQSPTAGAGTLRKAHQSPREWRNRGSVGAEPRFMVSGSGEIGGRPADLDDISED